MMAIDSPPPNSMHLSPSSNGTTTRTRSASASQPWARHGTISPSHQHSTLASSGFATTSSPSGSSAHLSNHALTSSSVNAVNIQPSPGNTGLKASSSQHYSQQQHSPQGRSTALHAPRSSLARSLSNNAITKVNQSAISSSPAFSLSLGPELAALAAQRAEQSTGSGGGGASGISGAGGPGGQGSRGAHGHSHGVGNRARSSSLVTVTEVGGDEQDVLVDRLGGENAAWVNAPGAWLIHPVLLLVAKVLVDAIPRMTQDLSWTILNLGYMVVSYIMFHYVTGIPIESSVLTGGAYDDLTLWEQIDSGAQYTPAKKWLTSVPICLFLVSTHYTKYDSLLFVINFAACLCATVPKLPAAPLPGGQSTLATPLGSRPPTPPSKLMSIPEVGRE